MVKTSIGENGNIWSLFGKMCCKFSAWRSNSQPLHVIQDYYGNEYGFYMAWVLYFNSQMLVPCLIGLAICTGNSMVEIMGDEDFKINEHA